jgi:Type II secretion system (T2SS), protein N
MPRFRTIALYSVIGIGTFAVASLTMLPASVAARALESATQGQVKLSATSGKAWNGRGDLTLIASGKPVVVRDCSWSVLGARLLAGELAVAVSFGGPDISGQATVARNFATLAVRDTKLRVSAGLLAEQIERLRGWGASGTVDLNAEDLQISADAIVGNVELLWRDATAIGFPTLGDYRLTIAGAGTAPAKIELATLRGPLQVNGRGEASPGKVMRFAGSARTDNGAPDKVVALVGALGPRRADGSFGFDLAVPLPRLATGKPTVGAAAPRSSETRDG